MIGDTEIFRQALHAVIDPEIGLNIVDLGLVYGLTLQDEMLTAQITMTSPACPMGQLIVAEAEDALRACAPPHICIEVNLVWEPAWTPEMMSDKARKTLGW